MNASNFPGSSPASAGVIRTQSSSGKVTQSGRSIVMSNSQPAQDAAYLTPSPARVTPVQPLPAGLGLTPAYL